jgi:hypothetical protein
MSCFGRTKALSAIFVGVTARAGCGGSGDDADTAIRISRRPDLARWSLPPKGGKTLTRPQNFAGILKSLKSATATKAHRTSTPDGVNGIIEFSETFPTDNLGDTTKLDPVTCELE